MNNRDKHLQKSAGQQIYNLEDSNQEMNNTNDENEQINEHRSQNNHNDTKMDNRSRDTRNDNSNHLNRNSNDGIKNILEKQTIPNRQNQTKNNFISSNTLNISISLKKDENINSICIKSDENIKKDVDIHTKTNDKDKLSIMDTSLDNTEKRSLLNSIFSTPLLPFNQCYKSLYFPKHIKRLSNLYSACLSVQKYNTQKNLKSIFIKCKTSLERMLKFQVSVVDFERLNYMFNIEFKMINILHEGRIVETFTFEMPELDFNNVFWEYIVKIYYQYLQEKGEEHVGNKFFKGFDINKVDQIPRKPFFEYKNSKDQKNTSNPKNIEFNEIDITKLKISKLENDTLKTTKLKNIQSTDEQESTNQKINENKQGLENNNPIYHLENNAVVKGISKAQEILQRIKEKERRRKEQFMNYNSDIELVKRLETRIQQLFIIEKRNNIKIARIIKLLNLHDGLNCIKKMCLEFKKYEIKAINNELFLCKK